MRTRKTKPKIGREKPYTCVNHPMRLAIVENLGADICWACYYNSLLEVIVDVFQRILLIRRRDEWIKRYKRQGQ